MNARFLLIKYMPYRLLHFLIKENCLDKWINTILSQTNKTIQYYTNVGIDTPDNIVINIYRTLQIYAPNEILLAYFWCNHEEKEFWKQKKEIYKL